MTEEPVRFETAIDLYWGHWPPRPPRWSYSSLKEIEACPRRWMLSRARYPGVSEQPGYPAPVSPATVFGDVIHLSLEVVIKALIRNGCRATHGRDAVGVARGLGGYTAVIERSIDSRLDRLNGSPSMTPDRIRRLRTFLVDRVPEARTRIQAILSRTELPVLASRPGEPAVGSEGGKAQQRPRGPLGVGTYPEAKLIAHDLRLEGRIDLLTVDAEGARIVDFKTGDQDAAHAEQVRIYALLWNLDHEANPSHQPVSELCVAYSSHDVVVTAPDDTELRNLVNATAERIVAADAAVRIDPEARPSMDNCQFCAVRHLCETYWSALVPTPHAVKVGEWLDLDGVVSAPNGSRSWFVRPTSGDTDVLLRTPSESTAIKVGRHIRVLRVRRDEEPDSGMVVTVMTPQSDLFVLA